LTAITREWNFEGWAVEKLTMVIQWSRLQPGLGNTSSLTLYISSDGGISYSTTISIDNKIVDYNETGPGRFYSANATYDLTRYASLFSPLTRVIIQINPVEAKSYLSIVYWGSGQKPVPPFDYTDEAGNYIQYCVSFQVSYRENIIPYTGSTLTDSNAINASNVNATANLIVKTMHPSGASNEYVGKQFGTDSWIVTYSKELAMISLIDVSKAIPDQNYLPVVKHYIPWLFSKQMPDGSFLFTLTDGDQHPWSNESSWVGYDKIDSFSALSITLMRKYYDATGDLTMVNQYFPNLALSKNFLAKLVNNTQRWIPADGYHYNNSTGYTNSTISQLQDSVEVYQSLEDYAYLEGIRGNSQEQRYWEAYANAVANGIRMLFWNETFSEIQRII
jgi:hypothetical protein